MPEISVWYDFGSGVLTGLTYSLAGAGSLLVVGLIWDKAQQYFEGLSKSGLKSAQS